MSSANIGWLFYKDYFKGLDYIELLDKKEDKNSQYIERKVQQMIESKYVPMEEEILGSSRFQGTTSYPGLLLGSGNAHEVPNVKGQAILGFHFDYTSGLPVIAGSSLKGVLRSAFKHPEYEYVQALLGEYTLEEIERIESEIFDNADIFFDATVIKADAYERLLGDDYLTPHSDPLKDPIPLRFIKVLPDVTFLFQFELSDNGILSKPEKVELFKKILVDLGLGAKSNVGYGKFASFEKAPRTPEEEAQELKEAEQRVENVRLQREAALAVEREAKANAEKEKQQRLAQEKQDALEAERKKREAFASRGVSEILEGCTAYKQLEANIKKYLEVTAFSEEDKEILEKFVLENIKDKKVKKRKDFPFGTLGNDNCLGKERANTLADKLGLK